MFFLRTEGAFHGGDPTLADAILDRSVSNAYKIELKGESMRQRQHGTDYSAIVTLYSFCSLFTAKVD